MKRRRIFSVWSYISRIFCCNKRGNSTQYRYFLIFRRPKNDIIVLFTHDSNFNLATHKYCPCIVTPTYPAIYISSLWRRFGRKSSESHYSSTTLCSITRGREELILTCLYTVLFFLLVSFYPIFLMTPNL